MMRAATVVLGLIGVLAFPWPYALLLAALASLYVPFAGLALGLISDALYYSRAASLIPWGTIAGAAITAAALLARRFMKSRVSELTL